MKTYPCPHLLAHAALTVGVCKGQGDTERVEEGEQRWILLGLQKVTLMRSLSFTIHTIKLTGTWREQGFLPSPFDEVFEIQEETI